MLSCSSVLTQKTNKPIQLFTSASKSECNAILLVGRHIYYFNMEFILVGGCRPKGGKSTVLHVFSLSDVDFTLSKDIKVRKPGFF